MMRALYTAASGMAAQQANIDNVAHNLANVNTTGFKKCRMEFEDLVYETTRTAGTPTSASTEAPVGLETGLGTRAVATARDFTTGNLKSTGGSLDIAIQGNGFFQIAMPDGTTAYTRAGDFHLDADGKLLNSEGMALQPEITVPPNATSVSISKEGVVSVSLAGQSASQQIGTIELATFQNAGRHARAGRQSLRRHHRLRRCDDRRAGHRRYRQHTQGFLEESNVSVVEEMVNMILGQRAYEANSRVIKAADEMLGQVNNLGR